MTEAQARSLLEQLTYEEKLQRNEMLKQLEADREENTP